MTRPPAQNPPRTWTFTMEDASRHKVLGVLAGAGVIAGAAGGAAPWRIPVTLPPMTPRSKQPGGTLRNSAGVVVFISDENEPASWGAAGRCCQRFALRAMALGIQPLNVAVGVRPQNKNRRCPRQRPRAYRAGRSLFRRGGRSESSRPNRRAGSFVGRASQGVGGSVGFATS